MCVKLSESFNPEIAAMAHKLHLDRQLPLVDRRCASRHRRSIFQALSDVFMCACVCVVPLAHADLTRCTLCHFGCAYACTHACEREREESLGRVMLSAG